MTKSKVTMRSVKRDDIKIEYTLERKKVKNVNLRVRTDGSVYVSANNYVNVKFIDAFVIANIDMILSARARSEKIRNDSPSERKYIDGETFMLLGAPRTLILTEGKNARISSDDAHIYMALPDISDFSKKEKLMKKYIDTLCADVFGKLIKKYYPPFKKYTPLPTLRMRTMKSRWGSCIPKKSVITLNKRLIEKPMPAIEYVMLHEYCHFVHQNHSKDFHALVETFMPDHKERRAMLKTY